MTFTMKTMENKQQTALTKLISTFKESIDYLESCLEDVTDETTRIQLKARLSQARYFLNYANEAKEMEKEQHRRTYVDSTSQFENEAYMPHIKPFEQYYKETYE